MKLLVWCGNFSIGGGMKLLSNLIPAMARQPDMELIRVVAGSGTGVKEVLAPVSPPNVEIVYYDQDIVTGQGLLADCHAVYYFWPHGTDFRPVNRPSICTFQDAIILDYVPPFTSGAQIRQYWERSNTWLSNVTTVVVSSEYVKDRLIHHYGELMYNCVVIPHAISPIRTQEPLVLRPEIASRLPSEYIVYPANTSPHKNHYNLLLAYSRFPERKQFPLVLIGYMTDLLRYQAPNWPQQTYLPTLVSLIKRQGLQLDVDYFPLGFVEDTDVPAIIKHARALIMPSLAEGGGSYPVEEALRLGTPVLCSDIPVMREHLEGRTAQISWFDPTSPASITDALGTMIHQYGTFKQSTLAGMQDPTLSWDDIAARYIETIRHAYIKFYNGK